jgi:hypothetical protein
MAKFDCWRRLSEPKASNRSYREVAKLRYN